MTFERPMETIGAIDAKLAIRESKRSPRDYLGISYAGEKCDRQIWLTFRWAKAEVKSGRIVRLLKRGQREEAEIVKLLRMVGVKVTHTGRKQAIVELSPWVKGHADGIIESGLKESPKKRHVLEMKTSNDKAFQDLKKRGVQAAKPMHYVQMQLYMLGLKIDRAFYWCVNKNDDEVYTERIYLDKDFAAKLSVRAIALSVEQNLPAPISKMPSWYECKICPFWGLCHNHEEADHSCRTCEHAHFNSDGTVMCKKRVELRDTKAQERGCKEFKLHFDLEQLKEKN